MPSTSLILQQPYLYSTNPDKEHAKIENQEIRERIKQRKKANKSIDSLLNPNETTVYLFFIIDRTQKVKLKTDQRILPKYWDFKAQKVKPSYPGSIEMNARLNQLKLDVNKAYSRVMLDRQATFTEIKDYLKKVIKDEYLPINDLEKTTFFDIYEEFITVRSKTLSPLTIKKYKTLKWTLRKFEQETGERIALDKIDLKFYDTLTDYLNNRGGNGSRLKEGLLSNTVGKYIESLKVFLRWSYDRGYHKNRIFDHKDFKVSRKAKNEIITLTWEEFNKVKNVNLTSYPRLRKVRDLFCFACYTGQRWSDLSNFCKDDIKNGIWEFRSVKTKKIMRIPLIGFTAPAEDILKAYDYELPVISMQKFNSYLKEVGELAGIREKVKIKRWSGKREVEIIKLKYEFMSSHMARRTCITLMLEKGVPMTTIMKLTGHSDIKTLMKYENTGEEALREELIRIGEETPLRKAE